MHASFASHIELAQNSSLAPISPTPLASSKLEEQQQQSFRIPSFCLRARMELSFDTNEGGLLAVDSHRSVPAPFLTKTFHFVDDASSDDIVSWSEDGTTFIVWRPPEFAKDILPNYFKHNNFSSFVRQLNTYGFRKIVSDRWEFANEFFRRGHQDLLCDIHRRKTGQPNVQPTVRPGSVSEDVLWSHISSTLPPPRSSSSSTSTSAHGFGTPVVSICDENERLRRDNCLLMSELARLRRLNDEVLMFLQNHARLPLQDLSCIKWFKYNSLPPLLPPPAVSSRFEEIVDDHNPVVVAPAKASESRFSSTSDVGRKSFSAAAAPVSSRPPVAASHVNENAAPKASTLSFLDSKLKELSSSKVPAPTMDSDAPKLFGVLLSGKKRSFSPEDTERQAKSPRSELSLELNTDPCWLKVCKTVSEKIYI